MGFPPPRKTRRSVFDEAGEGTILGVGPTTSLPLTSTTAYYAWSGQKDDETVVPANCEVDACRLWPALKFAFHKELMENIGGDLVQRDEEIRGPVRRGIERGRKHERA